MRFKSAPTWTQTQVSGFQSGVITTRLIGLNLVGWSNIDAHYIYLHCIYKKLYFPSDTTSVEASPDRLIAQSVACLGLCSEVPGPAPFTSCQLLVKG